MSASLVGSEMCIRDSSRAPWSLYRRAEPLASCEAMKARTTAGSNSEPVSYTHLTLPTICSV
eukprot:704448-Alexandrium_andersonii.AAC.1